MGTLNCRSSCAAFIVDRKVDREVILTNIPQVLTYTSLTLQCLHKKAKVERPDDWLYVRVAPFRVEIPSLPCQCCGGGHVNRHSVYILYNIDDKKTINITFPTPHSFTKHINNYAWTAGRTTKPVAVHEPLEQPYCCTREAHSFRVGFAQTQTQTYTHTL